MSRIHRSMLLLALTGATVSSAWAADTHVKLSGQEETPPVTTAATGTATISVAADKKVSGVVKTTGVDGTAAHIHAGGPGEKGPPVITLEKGENGAWKVPADAVLNDEQYAAYQAGKLYINIHSAANKGGEIRGQIKP
ncbi:MAG TPA: CHRD domain-containing protein [Povalibacter sp.]|uniref:CHRD domain-containing protein n=1 Tax=Povalibacter sp. TaxID=1962978 RepID=UPI002BFE7241|nr:CHRD domain-containing protein [Povalibacter sp.]HMN46114.1 CHRD domain-containing protein [Povalibacter sp.]